MHPTGISSRQRVVLAVASLSLAGVQTTGQLANPKIFRYSVQKFYIVKKISAIGTKLTVVSLIFDSF